MSKPRVFKYTHRFEVQAPLAEVAEFHARSGSLTQITPPPTKVIVHQAPAYLEEGDQMDFTLKLGPLPIRWVAGIERVTATGFVDRQLSGPFQHWVHHHSFEPLDETSTVVIDEIEFSLHSHLWQKIVGLGMALTLPLLFAYRAWKSRKLLEKRPGKKSQASSRLSRESLS